MQTFEERRLAWGGRFFYSGRLLRTVLSFFLLILPVLSISAQENTEVNLETIARPAAVFYKPNNRRDPFLNLVPPKTSAKENVDTEVPRGTPPPGIAGTFIDNAGFEGIIVVHSNNQRMAIIRSSDNRTHLLREGDRLFDGYLKNIENDSVVFVRETFMRSGRLLTQEVTKRLRQS